MSLILKDKIDGTVAWQGRELAIGNAWIHRLSPELLAALDGALRKIAARGLAAPDFAKDDFPLPDEVLGEISNFSEVLENGRGFIVIRGLCAERYNEDELGIIYYGIGLHMGQPVSQNQRGELLGVVANVGDQTRKSTRVYETNAYLPYHTDLSDVVGLLCIRKAKEGGLSSLVSAATIYNAILETYPEYLALLYRPFWCDHLGDELPTLTPIFSYHQGKLSCRYLRAYIELGQERRELPLSRVEIEALDLIDTLIHDPELRLDMMMEPGDIQFCNNYAVMHSRTHFEDHDDINRRRKLLRLWLKMPNARALAPDFPGRNGIPARDLHDESGGPVTDRRGRA